MLRLISTVLTGSTKKLIFSLSNINYHKTNVVSEPVQYQSILFNLFQWKDDLKLRSNNLCTLSNLSNKLLLPPVKSFTVPFRTVTKFSLKLGKRKTVKTVIKRFYRLNWGIWIRTIAGCHKHLWKKNKDRRIRAKQHVFINATQSWMLDRMVTKFWKRPRFFVNDPYTLYHTREEFMLTQKKPKPMNKQ